MASWTNSLQNDPCSKAARFQFRQRINKFQGQADRSAKEEPRQHPRVKLAQWWYWNQASYLSLVHGEIEAAEDISDDNRWQIPHRAIWSSARARGWRRGTEWLTYLGWQDLIGSHQRRQRCHYRLPFEMLITRSRKSQWEEAAGDPLCKIGRTKWPANGKSSLCFVDQIQRYVGGLCLAGRLSSILQRGWVARCSRCESDYHILEGLASMANDLQEMGTSC